jgi:nucleoside triphosphate diphosphatase
LRDSRHGCPWDRQQDFVSIAPHTLEEVYEVIDAIEQQDYRQLPDELGDLLFQIVFYAQLGGEQGLFDFNTIVSAITSKLLHRHPHVFPDATLASFGHSGTLAAEGVVAKWEAIKAEERLSKQATDTSALADVPLALPAMIRAAKLQKRAATQGFDWQQAVAVLGKVEEEIAELKAALCQQQATQVAEEFGDVLFTMVNLARHLQLEPEQTLRAANQKFEQRFRQMEMLIAADGLVMKALAGAELERYWQRVKQAENRPA